MSKKIEKQIAKLSELRLPELQAKHAEIVGEATRSPNKTYLLRRIREALEAQEREAREARRSNTPNGSDTSTSTRTRGPATGLTKLSIEELQQLYGQEVGRPTGSEDKGYLVWKIRMARKGKVRVGPARERKHEPGDVKVVPVTMARDTVAELDAVVKETNHASRSELIKRAIHDYLRVKGYGSVARRFEGA